MALDQPHSAAHVQVEVRYDAKSDHVPICPGRLKKSQFMQNLGFGTHGLTVVLGVGDDQ